MFKLMGKEINAILLLSLSGPMVFAGCKLGAKGSRFLHGHSLHSDAQSDQNLCWAHRPFSWFRHALSRMALKELLLLTKDFASMR